METLIMKYTLGTAFVVVTLVFGIKVILVVVTAAKLKLMAWGAAHSWMGTLIEGIRGAIQGVKP